MRTMARWRRVLEPSWWDRQPWRQRPPTGTVHFGALRRVTPINRAFGIGRGWGIDRYYIEQFLGAWAGDVRGRVLEVSEDTYTRKFGGTRVVVSDVLHVRSDQRATIVADLTCPDALPAGQFDCLILTQTLQFIFDIQAALRTAACALKPGGVLLATASGISQISRYDMDRWGECWRLTSRSAQCLLEGTFPTDAVTVQAYGNVLAAVGLLHGLSVEDVTREELDCHDRDYEVIIGMRAVKGLSQP